MKMKKYTFSLVVIAFVSVQCFAQKSEILIEDFESASYSWQQEGTAFGSKPSEKGLNGQKDLKDFEGKGFANSCAGGITKKGSLTSPVFVIARPYINFLISGAKSPEKACIKLIVDGKTVRSSTGSCEKSIKSERLEWATWDVKEFEGKNATIQIIGGGVNNEHINIDAISQSTVIREEPKVQREINIGHTYLHFPIGSESKDRRVRIVVDGKIVRDFMIQLTDGKSDTEVFSDVSSFKGKKLSIEIEHCSNPTILNKIVESDDLPGMSNMYQEKYRPQFHFSPRRGWVGDPNGLVYSGGEYHLFFQHNPYGLKWGNMHWGHAVSKDMVHWKELPIALYAPTFGDNPYSGSAIVDKNNIAGFKTGVEDPIILFYTSTGRGTCLTYSNDKGRTFTEFSGNPVMRSGGGDPKVFWHEASKQWVMITSKTLGVVVPATFDRFGKSECGFEFYTSSDLKSWKHQSRIEDYWECPELFELPVDGDKSHTKWVVYSNTTPSLYAGGVRAGGRYVIGSFDGNKFTEESAKLQFNFGNAYGAAQSYNNIPVTDGRRINVGCAFKAHMPGMPFEQMMNFPTELTLKTTEEGPRLFALPVKEIESLYVKTIKFPNLALTPQGTLLSGVEGDLFDINAEFTIGTKTEELGLNVRGIPVLVNLVNNQLICGDRTASLKPMGGKIKLRILVDRTSFEIFANDGRVYMPLAVIPKDENRSISAFSKGGEVKTNVLTVNLLKSAW